MQQVVQIGAAALLQLPEGGHRVVIQRHARRLQPHRGDREADEDDKACGRGGVEGGGVVGEVWLGGQQGRAGLLLGCPERERGCMSGAGSQQSLCLY